MTDVSSYVFPISGDVIDLLPPTAANHLRKLRQGVEDAALLRRAASDALNEARTALQSATVRLRDLERGVLGQRAGSVEQLEYQRERVGRAKAELDRLIGIEAARAEERTTRSRIVVAIEEFLKKIGDVAIADAPLPEVSLRKGEDVFSALGRVRNLIAEGRSKLDAIRRAPIPSEVIIRRMREQIAALGKNAAPEVEASGNVEFKRGLLEGTPAPIAPDAVGLVCWLLGDEIAQKLERDIRAVADDKNALSEEAKREASATVNASIFELERSEESLIRALEDEGRNVTRRPDAAALAVLSITTSIRERGELPASSPQHVIRGGGGRRATVARMG